MSTCIHVDLYACVFLHMYTCIFVMCIFVIWYICAYVLRYICVCVYMCAFCFVGFTSDPFPDQISGCLHCCTGTIATAGPSSDVGHRSLDELRPCAGCLGCAVGGRELPSDSPVIYVRIFGVVNQIW